MNLLKIAYYILLIILALIAILLIISMLPITGNYRFMVVQSGSMEPSIQMGGVVMVKPTGNYKIGDVITFKEPGKGVPTTHRIHDIEVIEGKPYYITKGDANNAPDSGSVSKDDVIGKVLLDIPYIGYVVNFAKRPIGFALMIIFPAVLVIANEIKNIYLEFKKPESS